MTFLISLLLFLTLNIKAQELTEKQLKEFNDRLELYGLTPSKSIPEPIALGHLKIKYDSQIILDLQNDIKNHYVAKLQMFLGVCESGNCIEHSSNYLTLKTGTQKICLPYTNCEFYKCMEEKYQCKRESVNYFTELAYPTCATYKQNLRKKYFTQKGFDWIYSVMVCLQKGLIDECELNKNCQAETAKKSCDYITDFTLKFHPSCYINSGIGVCNLPSQDKINIWRTVAKFLTKDEFLQAIETVKQCYLKEKYLN